jgi:hypothetical protein
MTGKRSSFVQDVFGGMKTPECSSDAQATLHCAAPAKIFDAPEVLNRFFCHGIRTPFFLGGAA